METLDQILDYFLRIWTSLGPVSDQIFDFVLHGWNGLVPVLIFFIFGVFEVLLGLARIYRYYALQQEKQLLYLAAKNILQGCAMGIASLVVAPKPVHDYSHLVPYSRLSWLLGLPLLVIAVCLEYWMLAELIRKRGKKTKGVTDG